MKKNRIKINNLFSVKNKNCIVTGGMGGIGKIISKMLAQNDCNVIVIDRKNIKYKYKNITYYNCDLTDKNASKTLIDQILKKFKKIDGLINTIGITDENSFISNINVNLVAVYNFTMEIIKIMKKTGGSIINFSSLNSELGFSKNPGYVSSKGAIKMLTKSLAVDYAKYKIRVNNLGPGYILTPMTIKNYNNKKKRNERISRIPLKRYGKPDELFGAIVFLISSASSYVTGQDFYIDGGFLSKGI